jgi:hypothetical protein
MDKPTRVRSWTEEDYKARDGWTIWFGPLLGTGSPKPSVQPKEQQPPKRRQGRKRSG